MTSSKKPASLSARILTPERLPTLNAEFGHLVEDRIRKSPGFKGVALRAGIAMLSSTKPDIVPRAVARLLPDFITTLDPLYADYHRSDPVNARKGQGFGAYLLSRREDAVAAMMQFSDTRSAGSTNQAYHQFYNSLRGTIAREADTLLPTLARQIDAELARDGGAT